MPEGCAGHGHLQSAFNVPQSAKSRLLLGEAGSRKAVDGRVAWPSMEILPLRRGHVNGRKGWTSGCQNSRMLQVSVKGLHRALDLDEVDMDAARG